MAVFIAVSCFLLGTLFFIIRVDSVQVITDDADILPDEEMVPSIKTYLQKEGFHRHLCYVINFKNSYKECDFTIEQKLPDAVYVDTDQLNEWIRHRQLNISFPSLVDIEKPTKKAKPIDILLHSHVQQKHFTIPIHYRYHAAGYHKFNRVEIGSPALYVSCPNLIAINNTQEDNMKCFDNVETLLYKCNWKKIPYTEVKKHPLKAHIPVGDKTLGPFFLCVTTVVSWASCFTIVYAINRKMKTISKKFI